MSTATFIAPDHFGPLTIAKGMTIQQGLDAAGLDGNAVVKLNGTQVYGDDKVIADAVYIVVPDSVAKGGFDGAA